MPFCAALVGQHADARRFPLPFGFLHGGHVTLKGLDQTVVPLRNCRQIAQAPLEIPVRIGREQRFPMSEPPLHILHTEPGQDRLLPDLHTFAQARNLGVDRLDLLIFFSQLSADVLTGLPIAHVSLVQRLNALKNGLALLTRFVGLASFLFNLVLQLLQCLSFFVDFLIDRIGPYRGAARGIQRSTDRWLSLEAVPASYLGLVEPPEGHESFRRSPG